MSKSKIKGSPKEMRACSGSGFAANRQGSFEEYAINLTAAVHWNLELPHHAFRDLWIIR